MPHASDIHGKYIPHHTNKIYVDDRPFHNTYNTSSSDELITSRSTSPPEKFENDIDQLEDVSIKEHTVHSSAQGFWTTKKLIILICCLVLLAICIAVAVVLVFMLRKTDTTSTTTQTTTTATTTTSTTSTTSPPNPCSSGALRWNTTATTVLSSSQILSPSGMYIDSSNTLFVVDETPNAVVWKLLYNAGSATNVAGVYQSISSASNRFNYPQDVYVDPSGNIYVTDYYNYRVQKFASGSSTGTTIAGITLSGGSGLSQFNGLRHMTGDSNGTYIYVTDYNNQRIMRYSTSSTSGTNGVLMAGNNGAGNSNTTLYYPWGIHYLPSVSNDLFITNYYGHTVMRWTPGASSGYFVAGVSGVSGQSPTLLNYPMGVKIDTYLNIYVADTSNNRIQLFCANSQTGITIAGTGQSGNSATQLNAPESVAFDSAMNLYVADAGNSRVQRFAKL
ncbi:unnamed protein product [Rotaria sordida]|uniref:NHL repeat containing protein n=3 Tax=Rotaria sordida TaxID=392033 RepID=A0A815J1A3_9BILA|nr:unnamed protein product [Rotaria sordida]